MGRQPSPVKAVMSPSPSGRWGSRWLISELLHLFLLGGEGDVIRAEPCLTAESEMS